MLSQEECVSPAREPRKPSKTRGQSQVSKRGRLSEGSWGLGPVNTDEDVAFYSD